MMISTKSRIEPSSRWTIPRVNPTPLCSPTLKNMESISAYISSRQAFGNEEIQTVNLLVYMCARIRISWEMEGIATVVFISRNPKHNYKFSFNIVEQNGQGNTQGKQVSKEVSQEDGEAQVISCAQGVEREGDEEVSRDEEV